MSLKILIVKTSALGDIVHAMPVLEYLKEKHPDAIIDWVVEKGGLSLIKAHPLVRKAIVLDSKGWRKSLFKQKKAIYDFIQALREEKYDLLYDFQSNIKSGLITAIALAKKKVGFGRKSVHEWPNLMATNTRFDPPSGSTIYERNLYLVQRSFHDDAPWEIKPRVLKSDEGPPVSSNPEASRYMVCFGSRWENKKIPAHVWKALIEKLTKEGSEVYIVYGSESEKREAEAIGEGFEGVYFLPPMTLPCWQNAMALMNGVIAVDSVGLHLAGYAGVPTFSFFGASSANVFAPKGPLHVKMQGACPYNVTFDKRCKNLRSCATGSCVKELSFQEILARFEEWKSMSENRCVSRPDRSPLES